MNDLMPLIDGGYEISFQAGDGTADARKVRCCLVTPAGDAITAPGPTPEKALQSAMREILHRAMRVVA